MSDSKLLFEKMKPTFLAKNDEDKSDIAAVRIYLSSPLTSEELNYFKQFLVLMSGSYGFVHAGVQIGNLRLDWYSDGLVHFRGELETKTWMETPLVIYDPCDGGGLPRNEATLKKICELVVHWNLYEVFNTTRNNCQNFVKAVLKQWNLSDDNMNQDNALGRYLNHLRMHPETSAARFFIDAKGKRKEFASHFDLDEYHKENFDNLDTQEQMLLKSFHRAFQIEELAERNKGIDKEKQITIEQLEEEKAQKCPAGGFTVYKKANVK